MKPTSLLALVLIGALACTVHAPGSSEEAGGLANGSFTAELDGFRIHYEVHGRGPVLMTLPNSWGLSLQALRAMYRPLEERLTLVYFDPRGMGGSGPVREDADRGRAAVRADFEALRQHLGLAKVNVLGWSNGAINLIWLAHDHPETLLSALFLHGIASFTGEDMKELSREHPDLMNAYAAFQKEVSDPDMPVSEKTARQRRMMLEVYFPTLFADRAAAPAASRRCSGRPSSAGPTRTTRTASPSSTPGTCSPPSPSGASSWPVPTTWRHRRRWRCSPTACPTPSSWCSGTAGTSRPWKSRPPSRPPSTSSWE
jgi:pimeloyl-ACP methyl ester carboxylesterase